MNDNRRHKEIEGELESVQCFRSDPPPGDVHTARTAVTALSPSFLEDLRRGKVDEPVTSRYTALPATDLVDHPPCDDDDDPITEVDVAQDDRKSTTRARVRDLNDRITAALAAATTAPPLSVPPPLELEGGPAPASVAPASAPPVAASVAPTAAPSVAPVASIAPVRMARRYEWADLVIALIYLVAIFASATTIGMTIAHAFGHR